MRKINKNVMMPQQRRLGSQSFKLSVEPYMCNMLFTTTTGRRTRCQFHDYVKFIRYRVDGKWIFRGATEHKHISLVWGEVEGGKQGVL